MIENKRCWCGCVLFHIDQDKHQEYINIICKSCGCKRTIVTPGCSNPLFDIKPDFMYLLKPEDVKITIGGTEVPLKDMDKDYYTTEQLIECVKSSNIHDEVKKELIEELK